MISSRLDFFFISINANLSGIQLYYFVSVSLSLSLHSSSYIQQCQAAPAVKPGLTLPMYLITPVQRIPRYRLLLKDIIKKTPEDHPDYPQLVQAEEKMVGLMNDGVIERGGRLLNSLEC